MPTSLISFLESGLLDFSVTGLVIYTLVFVQVTLAAVTLYLHRHQAHRALDLHPIVSHFFRFWLWIGTGMQTRAWAAIHRKHHAKCETVDDPHSPQFKGLPTLLLQGVELYRNEAKNQETLTRYGHGTPDDWIERHIYSKHSVLGLMLLLAGQFLAFGVLGLTVWMVQALWIPVMAAGIINGIGHYFGYRNFANADASTNIVPWAVFIAGEELHNNHHTFPTSPKMSVRWFEFDIGWLYIRILQFFGLAKPKPFAKLDIGAAKANYPNALEALLAQRYQVMRNFAKVLQAEWRLEWARMRKAKVLAPGTVAAVRSFFNNKTFNQPHQQEALKKAFSISPPLKTLHDMRNELSQLWTQNLSREQLENYLKEWCKRAEASNIVGLRTFALGLRSSYSF